MSLKNKIATITNQKNISLHSSGAEALYVILSQLRLKSDDVVLIPSFACERILLPFIKLNIKFEFVDIESDNVVPVLKNYESGYNINTRGILLMYPWGYVPKNLFDIIDWAKSKKIIIIEDIASAFGLTYKQRHLGTLGNYTFGSFGSDKLCSIGSIGFSNLINHDSIDEKHQIYETKLNYNSVIKELRKKRYKYIRPLIIKLLILIYKNILKYNVYKEDLKVLDLKLDNYASELDKRKKLSNHYVSNLSNQPKISILSPNNDQGLALRIAVICNDSLIKNQITKIAKQKKLWLGNDYTCPLHEWAYKDSGQLTQTKLIKEKIFNLISNPNNTTYVDVIGEINNIK